MFDITNSNTCCSYIFTMIHSMFSMFSICSDGMCISNVYMCDGKRDCADYSDENQTNCAHAQIVHGGLSSTFYYYDKTHDCLHIPLYHDIYMCIVILLPPLYIQITKFNVYETVSKSVSSLDEPCSSGMSFCRFGRHQCYLIYKRCIFERDIRGSPLHCEDTEHLKFCKDYECPALFKCPKVGG